VFVAREGRLTGRLAQRLAGVGGGEDMFETWMKRESDLVQATALAYAEREVLEASARAVQQASNDPAPCCWWLA
jgi:acyl-CoA oxidase